MARNNLFKLVATLITLATLVALGAIIYGGIKNQGKVSVKLLSVPADAQIKINDVNFSVGDIYLVPGSYRVEASKAGFDDYSYTANIANKDGQSILVLLYPNTPDTEKWATDNRKLYTDLEDVAGEQASDLGSEFQKKNPIVADLPYSNYLFTIGYRTDPSDLSGDSIIIDIVASPSRREEAVQQIRNMGYDPVNYKISFNNYRNPFIK